MSQMGDNQVEVAIAIDPTNPDRMFAFSNNQSVGLFAAYSIDGGATWTPRQMADGITDTLPIANPDSKYFSRLRGFRQGVQDLPDSLLGVV